jgi:outer membrane protein assembly factor BamA
MRAALLTAAAILVAAAARAADVIPETPPAVPGAKIAEIRIERVNVFDPTVPGEDWWPFRIANKIHYPTRETVIRRELLFAPGEVWDPLKVIQSERNLRSNGAFRRIDIVPVKRPDGQVDAVVRSQDSWTTNPRFSAGTEGGQSFFGLGVEEGNILGYGKSLAFDYGRNGGVTSSAVNYGDPRFMGTRMALNGGYSRGSTGDSGTASLTRPFYSLDAHGASAAAWSRTISEPILYRDAEQYSTFRKRRRIAEASVGRRLSQDRIFVQRVEAGWYADRAQYEPLPDTAIGSLPPDRELSGPTFGYSWVQPNYIKETNIDRMERVEDFNLGNEMSARGGYMAGKTGSDRDRQIFNASNQQGVRFAPGRFAIGRVGLTGRTAAGKWENGLVSADFNFFWKTNWRGDHTLVGHAEGAFGRALDRDSQIVLGGATGLRGYKNNSYTGGKVLLVNFEDRFFFQGEWFHLMRLGAAVFVDSGMVADERAELALRGIKSDIGAGLRAASSRSRGGGVARLDLAYALNREPGGGSRWVLSIKGGQAFSLFNSATAGVDPSPPSRLN